jgi:transposase
MAKRYRVTLAAAERDALDRMLARGRAAARKLAHARVLLLADASAAGPGWTDAAIAEAVRVSVRTIERVRQRFVEEGLEAALRPKPSQRVYRGKLDGEQEAKLIALACSSPPEGKKRWTLRLLAARMAELEIGPEVSHETVRQVLGKKRAPAASAADVVHPAPAVGRVRLAHGGRARGLLPPRRPKAAGGLPRRAEHPADRRGAGAAATASRAGRAL